MIKKRVCNLNAIYSFLDNYNFTHCINGIDDFEQTKEKITNLVSNVTQAFF